MSIPAFIHIMQNGDIWYSTDIDFTPSGSVKEVFRLNTDAHSQKLGTITGTSGNYDSSGGTGKRGKEIV